MLGGAPVIVLQQNAERQHGRQTQLANIRAGAAVASVVRTTLGPKSMLKYVLDPLGGVVMTNDGNAILREIDVTHPAAKSVIELSRAQDEEVGDGTTSVVIVTGEILTLSEELLNQKIHPTHLVKGYLNALEDAVKIMADIAIKIDVNDDDSLGRAISASIGSKMSKEWIGIVTQIAMVAARTIYHTLPNGKNEVDIKRFARVEKLPGGMPSDCEVVRGIAIEKDVTHAKMRRRIENPRIVLLDCPLEYKKGESMTNVEITEEDAFSKLLMQEEEEVRKQCETLAAVGCDLVITEKGVSDLAAHFLIQKNISIVRRAKKTDQNRLARVTGATIVNRVEEITEADVGTKCKLFEVKKIDDDYWTYLTECEDPKACTILLRGGSKDFLNEVERILNDALNVARNILLEGMILPAGGACEMEVSTRLREKSKEISGLEQWGYRAIGQALEVIPRTLAQNCGCDVVSVMAKLRAAHSKPGNENIGIDGVTGEVINTHEARLWDTYSVKQQVLKTSVECSALLMRVDDIVSGIGKKKEPVPQITNYDQPPPGGA